MALLNYRRRRRRCYCSAAPFRRRVTIENVVINPTAVVVRLFAKTPGRRVPDSSKSHTPGPRDRRRYYYYETR